ncbi:SixA phosphatase family protein [Dongia rigui]|uniref:Histidine phosphatase family protein n=1 Tax=Dongia rigui TaxID=940149 RepID=A0ABU5E498_9PROT|nr:histidine phosphatase family protein [Dongia rigui]MDY0874314.1 histidine phosphatase family protein [Dongia rigui]
MKTLILMRHAKSAWDAGDIADHDRPLSDRGRATAPLMGRWLHEQKIAPDLVMSSTALRATETLDLLRPYLPATVPIEKADCLYMALPREMLAALAKVNDAKVSTILLIGHNPGIGSLAHWLSTRGELKYLDRMQDKFPTGAVAVIDFDISSWRELDDQQGRLRTFKTPKDLAKD